MICGAEKACTKRRGALCFVQFMLEKRSIPALNTCAKMHRRPSEDLALTSAVGHSPKQTNASEHERSCGAGTLEEDRRNAKVNKKRA